MSACRAGLAWTIQSQIHMAYVGPIHGVGGRREMSTTCMGTTCTARYSSSSGSGNWDHRRDPLHSRVDAIRERYGKGQLRRVRRHRQLIATRMRDSHMSEPPRWFMAARWEAVNHVQSFELIFCEPGVISNLSAQSRIQLDPKAFVDFHRVVQSALSPLCKPRKTVRGFGAATC